MVALFTCKAKHMALAKATWEGLYLIQLLEIDPSQEYGPVKITGGHQRAIALSRDLVPRQRCKQIDIKCHFIRDALHSINTIYCPIANMLSDIMTKLPIGAKLKKKKIQRTFSWTSQLIWCSHIYINKKSKVGDLSRG